MNTFRGEWKCFRGPSRYHPDSVGRTCPDGPSGEPSSWLFNGSPPGPTTQRNPWIPSSPILLRGEFEPARRCLAPPGNSLKARLGSYYSPSSRSGLSAADLQHARKPYHIRAPPSSAFRNPGRSPAAAATAPPTTGSIAGVPRSNPPRPPAFRRPIAVGRPLPLSHLPSLSLPDTILGNLPHALCFSLRSGSRGVSYT